MAFHECALAYAGETVRQGDGSDDVVPPPLLIVFEVVHFALTGDGELPATHFEGPFQVIPAGTACLSVRI